MTAQRTFKQRVRARMAKTGESYTAARRQLIDGGDHPETDLAAFEPPVSDEAVTAATGRGWDAWMAQLDEAGAMKLEHPAIVELLLARDVEHWWAQTVTVGYERARGMRAPGQTPDGWQVSATKTIGVPVGRLYGAMLDADERAGWLPGAELHLRTSQADRSARFDWEDGESRINAYFDAVGDDRSKIAIQHVKLPDADSADAMRDFWRERVAVLKTSLETPAS